MTALTPGVLERAGLDRQTPTKLLKSALLGGPRAKDDVERALLLP